MKKAYEKPTVEAESSMLYEGIASCENKATFDPERCSMFEPEPKLQRKVSVLPAYIGEAAPFNDFDPCGCYTAAPANSGDSASDIRKTFRFADITLCISRKSPFCVSQTLQRFAVSEPSADLTVMMDQPDPQMEKMTLPYVGEDLFRRYYTNGSAFRIEMKGANGSSTAILTCRAGREALHYCVYFKADSATSITGWLTLLPMAWLLYPYKVLFLHASRVAWEGGAILFSAASGVGKTTQAKLWQTYGGGRIAGNDRTLLRRKNGVWQSYGYFEDGDAPIARPERLPLRAIVLLEQAEENRVRRHAPARAVQLLMAQTVLAQWDEAMRQSLLNEWLTLVQEIPIYRLQCRADQDAVLCLQRQLQIDEGAMQQT